MILENTFYIKINYDRLLYTLTDNFLLFPAFSYFRQRRAPSAFSSVSMGLVLRFYLIFSSSFLLLPLFVAFYFICLIEFLIFFSAFL